MTEKEKVKGLKEVAEERFSELTEVGEKKPEETKTTAEDSTQQ